MSKIRFQQKKLVTYSKKYIVNGANGSDLNDGLSDEYPLATVQAGINLAAVAARSISSQYLIKVTDTSTQNAFDLRALAVNYCHIEALNVPFAITTEGNTDGIKLYHNCRVFIGEARRATSAAGNVIYFNGLAPGYLNAERIINSTATNNKLIYVTGTPTFDSTLVSDVDYLTSTIASDDAIYIEALGGYCGNHKNILGRIYSGATVGKVSINTHYHNGNIRVEDNANAVIVISSEWDGFIEYAGDNCTLDIFVAKRLQSGSLDVISTSANVRIHPINCITGMSTGLLTGGVPSVGTPNTTYNVTAGFGIVADSYTAPLNPTFKIIHWDAVTNKPSTRYNLSEVSFVRVSKTGVISESSYLLEGEMRRDYILLGLLDHFDKLQIDAAKQITQGGILSNNIDDLNGAIAAVNLEGNDIIPYAANNQITKTAGKVYLGGANFGVDKKSPNVFVNTVMSPATNFRYVFRDGLGGFKTYLSSVVLPAYWDDGTVVGGTLPNGAVLANQVTAQVCYYDAIFHRLFIHFSQTAPYGTLANSILYFSTDSFIPMAILARGTFKRSIIYMVKPATPPINLQNIAAARFQHLDKFGE